MCATATKVSKPEQISPALTKAIESNTSHVIDIDIDLNSEGYRSVWYPYPDNFWTQRHELKKHF
jgi:thiamine pyrophosphate-dependent acetolactate synthase large subunit-like protein